MNSLPSNRVLLAMGWIVLFVGMIAGKIIRELADLLAALL